MQEKQRVSFLISSILSKSPMDINEFNELTLSLENSNIDFGTMNGFYNIFEVFSQYKYQYLNEVLFFCYIIIKKQSEEIALRLIEKGFIEFLIDGFKYDGFNIKIAFKALSLLTNKNIGFHNHVLFCFHSHNNGQIGIFNYLNSFPNIRNSITKLIRSFLVYELSSVNDLIELIDSISFLINLPDRNIKLKHTINSIRLLIYQKQLPYEYFISSNLIQNVQNLYFDDEASIHICVCIGSFIEMFPYNSININISQIFSSITSSNDKLRTSSSWCIGMIAHKSKELLFEFDVVSYLKQLNTLFENSTFEDKISYYFPIITISKICNIEQLIEVCNCGLIMTYVEILNTKSVLLLDETLHLFLVIIENGIQFDESVLINTLNDIRSADDFNHLEGTRIHSLMDLIFQQILNEESENI